jgi:hypothetical protein
VDHVALLEPIPGGAVLTGVGAVFEESLYTGMSLAFRGRKGGLGSEATLPRGAV